MAANFLARYTVHAPLVLAVCTVCLGAHCQSVRPPTTVQLARFGTGFAVRHLPERSLMGYTLGGIAGWRSVFFETSLTVDGASRALPLGRGLRPFAAIDQRLAPCSVTYRCQDPDLPVRLACRWTAPYAPQEWHRSAVPVIEIELLLENESDNVVPAVVQIGFQRPATGALGRVKGAHGLVWNAYGGTLALVARTGSIRPAPRRDGLRWEAALAPKQKASTMVYLMGYADPGADAALSYQKACRSVEQVALRAFATRDGLSGPMRAFEQTILSSSLPPAWRMLICASLQGYLHETWLIGQGGQARVVTGADRTFRTPISLIEAQAVFASQFDLDLLTSQLDSWLDDLPADLSADEMTSLILAWHTAWRYAGDRSLLRSRRAALVVLLERLRAALIAPPGPVNQGKGYLLTGPDDHLYRQIGRWIAVRCANAMAEAEGIGRQSRLQPVEEAAMRELLARDAWAGDHFVVTADQSVRGWNAYNLLTGYHVLLPLRAGEELPVSWPMMAQSLRHSFLHGEDACGVNVTPIRGVEWRAAVIRSAALAAYLNILDEALPNRLQACLDRDGFFRTAPGVITFVMLDAYGGVQHDALGHRLLHATLAPQCRFPVPVLSGGLRDTVPWLIADKDGKVRLEPSRRSLELALSPLEKLAESVPPLRAGQELQIFWGNGQVDDALSPWGAKELTGERPFEVFVWYRNANKEPHDVQLQLVVPPMWTVTPLGETEFESIDHGQSVLCRYAILAPRGRTWPGRADVRARATVWPSRVFGTLYAPRDPKLPRPPGLVIENVLPVVVNRPTGE